MNNLLIALVIACIKSEVPNPYTINNLPKEQQEVLHDYYYNKCLDRYSYLDNEVELPYCPLNDPKIL